MKIKRLLIALLAILPSLPAAAVLGESDFGQTLSELRFELRGEIDKMAYREDLMREREGKQHESIVEITKQCNEWALMLYSQSQDFTFEMAYALQQVKNGYEAFREKRMPFDDIVSSLNQEIDRYARLEESLRQLPHADSSALEGQPFLLDSLQMAERDSCLQYAKSLLAMYTSAREVILRDKEFYEEAEARLKESYDYANLRYENLRNRMFLRPMASYPYILRNLKPFVKEAFTEAGSKYSSTLDSGTVRSKSSWRGPVVAGLFGYVLGCILLSVLVSALLVWLLGKKVPFFSSAGFLSVRWYFSLASGFLIFAIVAGMLSFFPENGFLRLSARHLLTYAWLVAAIMICMLIRLRGDKVKSAFLIYLPIFVLALPVFSFRILFVPNKIINLLFPLLMLIASVWQLIACRRHGRNLDAYDRIVGWVGFFVLSAITVLSMCGYVLLGVLVSTWWTMLLTFVSSVLAIGVILDLYMSRVIQRRLDSEGYRNPMPGVKDIPGANIRITWFYDFLSMVLIPVLFVLILPCSIWWSLGVFDMMDFAKNIIFTPFIDLVNAEGEPAMKVSMYMLAIAAALYFVFRYIGYLIKSCYRLWKLSRMLRESGREYLHTNEVNLTFADNLIGILVWGSYTMLTVSLLNIPTGALAMIGTGLAAGIGLALKDVINNFIYGIQLMSGRLRPGDWIICDGMRGKVSKISYQSTQIETVEGAVVSFLNTDLFRKNFKNLTRKNNYEFVKIVVGVAYGSDLEKVRSVISSCLPSFAGKDSFGQDIVDPERGVSVVFEDFGDSSVNVAVKMYVLVHERAGCIARAGEAIYRALGEAGIEIPFPQRDVHIRN